jgi:hypothetical protein
LTNTGKLVTLGGHSSAQEFGRNSSSLYLNLPKSRKLTLVCLKMAVFGEFLKMAYQNRNQAELVTTPTSKKYFDGTSYCIFLRNLGQNVNIAFSCFICDELKFREWSTLGPGLVSKRRVPKLEFVP